MKLGLRCICANSCLKCGSKEDFRRGFARLKVVLQLEVKGIGLGMAIRSCRGARPMKSGRTTRCSSSDFAYFKRQEVGGTLSKTRWGSLHTSDLLHVIKRRVHLEDDFRPCDPGEITRRSRTPKANSFWNTIRSRRSMCLSKRSIARHKRGEKTNRHAMHLSFAVPHAIRWERRHRIGPSCGQNRSPAASVSGPDQNAVSRWRD